MQKQPFFELKMTKTTLILYENELISLLENDTAIWARAVQRGKAILRRRQELSRQSKARVPPELRAPL